MARASSCYDPADPAQGIFLLAADGTATRVERFIKLMPGERRIGSQIRQSLSLKMPEFTSKRPITSPEYAEIFSEIRESTMRSGHKSRGQEDSPWPRFRGGGVMWPPRPHRTTVVFRQHL
jgi:hypothetical protein